MLCHSRNIILFILSVIIQYLWSRTNWDYSFHYLNWNIVVARLPFTISVDFKSHLHSKIKYSEMNNLKHLTICDICLEDLGYK